MSEQARARCEAFGRADGGLLPCPSPATHSYPTLTGSRMNVCEAHARGKFDARPLPPVPVEAAPLTEGETPWPEYDTYGDLPAEIRALLPSHEWDNMIRAEQRSWLVSQLRTALAEREELRTTIRRLHLLWQVDQAIMDAAVLPRPEEQIVRLRALHTMLAALSRPAPVGEQTP